MPRLRSLSVPVLVATMLFVALAPKVRADGPASQPVAAQGASAVSQLTDDERRFIDRRMPDFNQKDETEREKIAVNVRKLFALPPEARAKLLERLERANTAGPGAKAVVARLPGFQTAGSGAVLDAARTMRAVANTIVAGLPSPARDLVTVGATPASMPFHWRAQLDGAIANLWKRKIFEALIATPPTDAEPTANSPKDSEFVARRDAVKVAGGAAAPEQARRRFAQAYLEDRKKAAHRQVGSAGTVGPDAKLELLGRAMADAFPDAALAVRSALATAAEQGRPGLEKFIHDATDQLSPRERGLVDLVVGLEKARRFTTGDVLVRLVELQLAALRVLKVSDADLDLFARATDEKPRLFILGSLVRRANAADLNRGPHGAAFPWLDRGRARRADGGMGDGAMGDGGKSDDDK